LEGMICGNGLRVDLKLPALCYYCDQSRCHSGLGRQNRTHLERCDGLVTCTQKPWEKWSRDAKGRNEGERENTKIKVRAELHDCVIKVV
jgi:hypothetical protein